MKVFIAESNTICRDLIIPSLTIEFGMPDIKTAENATSKFDSSNFDYILHVITPDDDIDIAINLANNNLLSYSGKLIYCYTSFGYKSQFSVIDYEKLKAIGEKIVSKKGKWFKTHIEVIQFLNNAESYEITDKEEIDNYFVLYYDIISACCEQWLAEQRNDNLLLTATDLIEAEKWLHSAYTGVPEALKPTDLHCEFICKSKEFADNNQTDLFIGYKEQNSELANMLRTTFMRNGITCWSKQFDVKQGFTYSEVSRIAIDKATNLIYIIDSGSLNDNDLISELEYASKRNKRIFTVSALSNITFTTPIKVAQQFVLLENTELLFSELIYQLINAIKTDANYHELHRDILVKALNWERKLYPPALLLNGFDLETAKLWLKNNKERKEYPIISIQEKFVVDSEKSRISVFISYGRKHSSVFAAKLQERLNEDGFNVWFDKNDIPLGVDFQAQIDTGIENADNFIFIISPHSIKSIYCQKEVILAIKYNKRIIPILHVEPNDCWEMMHPVVGKLNWIYSREVEDFSKQLKEWEPLDDFDKSYNNLATLLHRHSDYLKQHTQLLNKALEWDRNQQAPKYLLTGQQRLNAENWLSVEFKNEQPPCQPTELHCEYIEESRKRANNGYTDAFLSYATKNRVIREKVDKALARNGITTWVHSKDIKKGLDFERSLREGIEQTDNLIYFISPEALESDYCKMELEYAIQYKKRIVPILIEPVDQNLLNPYVKSLQFIDFTHLDDKEAGNDAQVDYANLTVTQRAEMDVKARKEKTKWEKSMDELVQQIFRNRNYFELHKKILVQAIKWKNFNNNSSFLLRGNELYAAQAWHKIGITRNDNLPQPLHEELINESVAKSGTLNTEVFLCYSQIDADFAQILNNALQAAGRITWFDQTGADSTGEESREIFANIESATNFAYIISPETVTTAYCTKELEHAQTHNKRIIAIYSEETPKSVIPDVIASMNVLDFTKADFSASFSELIKVLDSDREYLEHHSHWVQLATKWKEKNRNADLLLRGSELTNAQKWLQSAIAEKKSPPPSELQIEFIERSDEAFKAFIAKERQRKIVQRLMLATIVLCIGIIIAGLIARKEHQIAVQQTIIAEKLRVEVKEQKTIIKKTKNNQAELDSLRAIIEQLKITQPENVATAKDKSLAIRDAIAKDYNQAGDAILKVAEKLGILKKEERRVLVLQAKQWYEKALQYGYKDATKGLDKIKNKKAFSECLVD